MNLNDLYPLLARALAASKGKVPNVTNALDNGYDPGIMNDMLSTAMYHNDNNIDDAMQVLDNQYGPMTYGTDVTRNRMLESMFDNLAVPKSEPDDWNMANSLDDYMADSQDTFEERDAMLERFRKRWMK